MHDKDLLPAQKKQAFLGVLVHLLMRFLISQSTQHTVLRTSSDTDHDLSPPPPHLQLIVFAPLINLSQPRGTSHIGFWRSTGGASTRMGPDFSNELQPLGPGASLPAVIGTCLGGDSPSCQDIWTGGTVGWAGFYKGSII